MLGSVYRLSLVSLGAESKLPTFSWSLRERIEVLWWKDGYEDDLSLMIGS